MFKIWKKLTVELRSTSGQELLIVGKFCKTWTTKNIKIHIAKTTFWSIFKNIYKVGKTDNKKSIHESFMLALVSWSVFRREFQHLRYQGIYLIRLWQLRNQEQQPLCCCAQQHNRREIITVRGQSYVLRLPKYWPPTPLTARRVCNPRLCCGGEDTLAGWRGGVGGNYFGIRKTQLCTLPISNPLWAQHKPPKI